MSWHPSGNSLCRASTARYLSVLMIQGITSNWPAAKRFASRVPRLSVGHTHRMVAQYILDGAPPASFTHSGPLSMKYPTPWTYRRLHPMNLGEGHGPSLLASGPMSGVPSSRPFQ